MASRNTSQNRVMRTDITEVGRWWWTVDRLMLGFVLALALIGIVLVSAASPPVAERLGLGSFHFVNRHVFFLVPSLLIMLGVSMLSRKGVWRVASLAMVMFTLLTAATLVFGFEIKGATRWIHVGGFSLQPSEFLKPAIAVVTAWLLARSFEQQHFPGHLVSAGVLMVVCGLLALQPDIGMTFVICAIWAAEIFISGFPWIWVAALGGVFASLLLGAYFVFPHFTSRMNRFLDPNSGDNYQVQKSLEAFAEGGIFGTGPGHGVVKLRLPDAHADFIFSVAGEEFGLFFALALIGMFTFIIVRAMRRAMGTEDMFTILAVGGLMTQFGLQAFIHMGSSLQLLPAKGMTLPFISYGGSSLLSLGFGMGMVLALTRRTAASADRTRHDWVNLDARPAYLHKE